MVASPKRLYLIDASGFIFRAYHALPPLTNPAGTPVGAVYGFITMTLKLMEGSSVDYVGVVFDKARKTFRNKLYPEYKAHRPPAPEDLVPQFPLVRKAATALNLPVIELDDYEADDIIAGYAKAAGAAGMEVVIVSSDKDLMQCIRPGVTMFDAMKQKTIGEKEVMEKFGVGPDKVADVLALIGDASDNVPGVPGIGPKTAAELIHAYGDLESTLARAGEIKQPKRRETLLANVTQARLSRKLIQLADDMPLPVPIEQLALKAPDAAALEAFLAAQGFKSLILRLKGKFGFTGQGPEVRDKGSEIRKENLPDPRPPASAPSYALIQDLATLNAWIERARAAGAVAFDTETTSLDAMRAELVGFSLSMTPGEACYVPLGHVIRDSGIENRDDGPLFANPQSPIPNHTPGQAPLAEALHLLKPLLEDPAVLKIGQNIKYDMQVMARHGIGIAPVDDTMLFSYVLGAGLHPHNMDDLAARFLSHKTITYDEVTGTGRNRVPFAEVTLEKARDYAAEDADVTLRLHRALKPKLFEQKLLTVYETIERPLIPVLAAMERRGVRIDAAQLRELSRDFARRMGGIEEDVWKLAGRQFTLASPKQLGEVLFDELGLPGGRKSAKSGAYTTDSDVLEELAAQGHAIAQKVLDWRQLAKLKSTYADALAEQVNPDTGRVHTSYAMAIAATGRLSSTDPNLQNIPIRTEEGRKIRRAFVAAPGCKLISADYSQIELRLLAHMADIAPLKTAFRNNDDIHTLTASQMFGAPVAEVTPDQRRGAKMINFGIIYGMSAHGLATRLGIPRGEAAAFIERYFAQYPGIRDYMEAMKDFARRHGYVATLYGRRCHLPGILDKNAARRQFAERQAINAPLQGTAADIIKRAMIRIHERQHGSSSAMLLQVHDELVFEAPANEAEATAALAKSLMEGAASLSVPLTVETGIGDHWGAAH